MHAFQDPAMSRDAARTGRSPDAHGRTLIELLVAMVIGFVILGAVMLTSVGTKRTSSVNQQMARLQEDAAIAGNLLTMQLRLAGYSAVRVQPTLTPPAPIEGPVVTNRRYGGPPVVGCENGFNNNAVANFGLLTCAGGAANTAPDALSIIYEGDDSNTMPTAGAAATSGTDCLGAEVTNTTPVDYVGSEGAETYARVENRYFIATDPNTNNPALYCAGVGSNAFANNAQPLIDNVIDMQITYGVSDVPSGAAREAPTEPYFDTVRYMRADQVTALPRFPELTTPAPDAFWRRVNSATVCVLLRSEPGALDRATQYLDCQGNVITPAVTDLRAYRAVRVQVAFKNRTAPCPDVTAVPRPDHCNLP
jgi:type IV pilus assembly protein PilW